MAPADTKIAGRYGLERRLGTGGMSTVHLAFDERLERHVAIKLLAEHLADDPSFVSRFKREALSAARLVHPNVVQVFDFGYDERAHQHFIVMERIDGPSGALLLREQGHLTPEDAVDMCVQSCRGLDYAHRHGVVHRDVKPGNLLRSREGVVKLADFGIAKAAEQSSITQVGSVLGTAAYLAPEQARGEEAGPAADIYSLAVVAYQLLSGRLPYEATSLSELALKQQREQPDDLAALEPGIPPNLARAVAHGLALDPAARPPDALAFGALLERGARGGDVEAPADTDATLALAGTEAARFRGGGDETAATQIGRPTRRSGTAEIPAVPAVPRRSAPRRGEPPATRPPAAARRRDEPERSSGRRRLAVLVVLLLLLGGGAAAIIATSNSGKAVQARQVMGRDFQQVYDGMRGLIDDNTR